MLRTPRQPSYKDHRLYLRDSTEQGHRQGSGYFFVELVLIYFYCMCFQISTITTNTHKSHTVRWRQANPNNLRTVPLSSITLLSIPIGLWNSQSAVNKADFLSSITTHSSLNLVVLTETWIKPEDTATNFTFSHTLDVWEGRRDGSAYFKRMDI